MPCSWPAPSIVPISSARTTTSAPRGSSRRTAAPTSRSNSDSGELLRQAMDRKYSRWRDHVRQPRFSPSGNEDFLPPVGSLLRFPDVHNLPAAGFHGSREVDKLTRRQLRARQADLRGHLIVLLPRTSGKLNDFGMAIS